MGSEIVSSDLATSLAAERLRCGLDVYCSLRLSPLAGALPGRGSEEHDGRIASSLRQALDAYRLMLVGDAQVAGDAHDALGQVDASLATGMGGEVGHAY